MGKQEETRRKAITFLLCKILHNLNVNDTSLCNLDMNLLIADRDFMSRGVSCEHLISTADRFRSETFMFIAS